MQESMGCNIPPVNDGHSLLHMYAVWAVQGAIDSICVQALGGKVLVYGRKVCYVLYIHCIYISWQPLVGGVFSWMPVVRMCICSCLSCVRCSLAILFEQTLSVTSTNVLTLYVSDIISTQMFLIADKMYTYLWIKLAIYTFFNSIGVYVFPIHSCTIDSVLCNKIA